MRLREAGIRSVGASMAVLILLLSGAAFAYATRAPGIISHNNPPAPLNDNESSSTTSSSGNQGHGTSHTESERHSETHASSTTQTETSESEKEHGTSTETQAGSSTGGNGQGENEDHDEHELKFRIVPVAHGGSGQGEANIAIHGTLLKVDVEIEKAQPSTSYDVVLFAALTTSPSTTVSPPTVSSSTTTPSTASSVTSSSTTTASSTSASGSSQSLGTIVTNDEGDGHLHAEVRLAAGTYLLGVRLAVSGDTQLTSDPDVLTGVLSASGAREEENQETGEKTINHTVKEEKQDEDNIKHAEATKTIPAVIQYSGSGSTAQVLDPRFSVSIGKVEGGGLSVSISAKNVTGPKVLLINLTTSFNPTSLPLSVTLDGQPIQEASSVTQVLNPIPTDSARFLIVTTSSGSQLLVSIPHFSLHVIQVLPTAAANPTAPESFLAANGLLLVGSAIAVVAAAAVLFKMRRTVSR